MANRPAQTFGVPKNFKQLLREFTREVLREQPTDIFEYGYAYFSALEQVSLLTSMHFYFRASPSTSVKETDNQIKLQTIQMKSSLNQGIRLRKALKNMQII